MSAGSDEPSGKQLALDQIDGDVRRKWGSLTPEGVDPEPDTLAEAAERAAHGGFVEAEGCISLKPEAKEGTQINYQIRPSFSLGHAKQAGFIEGEGTITVQVGREESYKINYAQSPNIRCSHVKQGGAIKKKFERLLDLAGADGTSVLSVEEKRDNKEQWSISISKPAEVKQLLLKLYPWLGHKRKEAHIMLADVLPIFEEGRHTRKRGFLEVMRHKDRMDEAKPDSSVQKYDYQYFYEKWGDDVDAQTRFGEDWGASA